MLACLECVGAKSRTPTCGKFTTFVSFTRPSSRLIFSVKGRTAREDGLGTRLRLLCLSSKNDWFHSHPEVASPSKVKLSTIGINNNNNNKLVLLSAYFITKPPDYLTKVINIECYIHTCTQLPPPPPPQNKANHEKNHQRIGAIVRFIKSNIWVKGQQDFLMGYGVTRIASFLCREHITPTPASMGNQYPT